MESPEEGCAFTVEEWLRLHEARPEEAAHLLLATSRRAVSLCLWQAADREDAIQEVVLRALAGNAAALRRSTPTTTLDAWVRGCHRNVLKETARTRRKFSGMDRPLDDVPSPAPSPFEILAGEEEGRHSQDADLTVACDLPQPYGHVLCWLRVNRLTCRGIQSCLNAHRPPGSRPIAVQQTRRILRKAGEMLDERRAGAEPRVLHPQRYLRSKNPWIGAELPPLASLIQVEAPIPVP